MPAKIYRWVNKQGQVVYSQLPPSDQVKAEEIEIKAPPPANPPPKPKKNEPAQAANPATDPKIKQEFCQKAKQVIQILEEAEQNGTRYFINEKNEVIKLDERTLIQKKREAEFARRAYCD